jgi:hypothetical protein
MSQPPKAPYPEVPWVAKVSDDIPKVPWFSKANMRTVTDGTKELSLKNPYILGAGCGILILAAGVCLYFFWPRKDGSKK